MAAIADGTENHESMGEPSPLSNTTVGTPGFAAPNTRTCSLWPPTSTTVLGGAVWAAAAAPRTKSPKDASSKAQAHFVIVVIVTPRCVLFLESIVERHHLVEHVRFAVAEKVMTGVLKDHDVGGRRGPPHVFNHAPVEGEPGFAPERLRFGL